MKKFILFLLPAFLLVNCSFEKKKIADSNEKEITEIKSFINPPLGISIDFITLSIDPSRDTLIQFESGSFLEIPKNCFVDNTGKIVTQPTQLKFREFDSNEDIFLSGIPMVYGDENGNHYFESAGMCELKPVDDIQFAQGKEVTIGLNSQSTDTDFDLYSFDENTGKWNNIGKDSVLVPKIESKEKTPSKKTNKKHKEKILPAPVKPNKLDAADPRLITIELANEQYVPELRKYENVLFHVSEKSKYKRGESNKAWYYVEVKNTDTRGLYKLKFYGKSDEGEEITLEYYVEPALEGKDYDVAIAEYDDLYKEYKKDMDAINKRKEKEEEELKKIKEEAKKLEKFIDNIDNSYAGIQRVFTAEKFGIYNCDRFYRSLNFVQFYVNYQNTNNEKITFYELYCIDNETRTVLSIGFIDRINFPTNNQYSFWGVTGEGKLATINRFDLTKQEIADSTITMQFNTSDVTGKGPEEIKNEIRASF